MTPDCPQAHLFEREIAEQYGVCPEGHPWLKPVRLQSAQELKNGSLHAVPTDIKSRATSFFTMRGEEIHEVAVGPVHAGIIEPGHFRFQCHGELVYYLEISLGYQHRGIEQALVGGPTKRTIHCMETAAGDTSIGHATAYCQALEGLAGITVPARAEVLRGVALELERLANHTGDLGALAGDVGYLPTASYCGRIRGDFLNLTALLSGSRFGRGMIRPGGVGFDVDQRRTAELSKRLDIALKDVAQALGLLWNAPSVQARFEDIGTLSRQSCEMLGLVGRQLEPVASSRIYGTISQAASSDSPSSPCPLGIPAMSSLAHGFVGLRFSAPCCLSRSNWQACLMAQLLPSLTVCLQIEPLCRSSRGGAAKSAMS